MHLLHISCLLPQGQLQVPLLRPEDQVRLPSAATDGRAAAHGHEAAALRSEKQARASDLDRNLLLAHIPQSAASLNFLFSPLSIRIKPAQKSPSIANGTSAVMGQQQVKALCDISAQVQQYQQFLGE